MDEEGKGDIVCVRHLAGYIQDVIAFDTLPIALDYIFRNHQSHSLHCAVVFGEGFSVMKPVSVYL